MKGLTFGDPSEVWAICPRCHERPPMGITTLCRECEQWYCFNCGNDLPCPAHNDGTGGTANSATR